MPSAPPKPCSHVSCGKLVLAGSRCETHKVVDGRFADRRRGSRHQRGYGNDWTRKRNGVLVRDGGLCVPCWQRGHVTQAEQVDHVTPKAEGGTDDDDNLQSICDNCHKAKTACEAARARAARYR